MSYLPCELHCHTFHSDGSFTPEELQSEALKNSLSLIALTDHNTLSGYDFINGSIPVIKGIEWTTYFGHMLVLGAERTVDWRDAVPDNIDKKIAEIKAAGGTVGVAHPFQLGSPICTGGRWEFNVKDWSAVDYIEIWHEAFYPENAENSQSLRFWSELLDKGYRIAATYGRDWHRKSDAHFGCTYLFFDGKPTPQKALSALKEGRTAVSSGAKIFLTAEQNGSVYTMGDTLSAGKTKISVYTDIYARRLQANARIVHRKIKLVTNNNKTVSEIKLNQSSVELTLNKNSWYKAELYGEFNGKETLLAVTSPIYTD